MVLKGSFERGLGPFSCGFESETCRGRARVSHFIGLEAMPRLPRFRAARRAVDVPHLRTRLHEAVRKDLPPASWRHVAEWVDLEMERVGLEPTDDHGLGSRWGSEEHIQPEPSAGPLAVGRWHVPRRCGPTRPWMTTGLGPSPYQVGQQEAAVCSEI